MYKTCENYNIIANSFKVSDISEKINVVVPPSYTKAEVFEELSLSDNSDWFCLVKDSFRTYGYFALDYGLDNNLEQLAGETAVPISTDIIVPNLTSLLDIVDMFLKNYYFVVLQKNQIYDVVCFKDLDKLPFKLCVFSLITELEANMIKLICDSGKPIEYYFKNLTKKRQEEIVKLCTIKFEKFGYYEMLISSNFIDKKNMIEKDDRLVAILGFSSKQKMKDFFGRILNVRNSIAHSDSIINHLNTPEKLKEFIDQLQLLIENLDTFLEKQRYEEE